MSDDEIDPLTTLMSGIVTVMMLPIILKTLYQLASSPVFQEVFASYVTAVAGFILVLLKLGIVGGGGAYAAFRLGKTVGSSPYPVRSVGVNGRPLSVKAVDLGDHDDAECLTCGRDDGPGVRRGYVDVYTAFGIPLREFDRSETYDCVAHTGRDGLNALDTEDQDALDLALDHAADGEGGEQA